MNEISSSYSTIDVLPDGRTVFFRAIGPADRDTLREEFFKLGPESIRNRFFNAKLDLTPAELEFLTEVDFSMHVALVAELEHDDQRFPVGVGRFVRAQDHSSHAEIALTVTDEYQGKGIGKTLLRQLIYCAKKLGIGYFDAMIFADNKPMSKLMLGMGVTTQSSTREGVSTLSLRL